MCDFSKAASASSSKPAEKCPGDIEMCDFQLAAPTDPAGMYLDPLTTAEGRAAMMRGEVLPEVGEQISLWKKAGKKLGKIAECVIPYFDKLSKVYDAGKTMVSVGKFAYAFRDGQLPSQDEAKEFLKENIDVVGTIDSAKECAKKTGEVAGVLAPSESEDKSKSCWVRTEPRAAHRSLDERDATGRRKCGPGQEKSAGLCFDKCTEGKGVGPLCKGSCPAGTKKCGLLCQDAKESCSELIFDMSCKAIGVFTKSLSAEVFGAVENALAIGCGLVYPQCSTFNGINMDDDDDEDEWWIYWELAHDPYYFD